MSYTIHLDPYRAASDEMWLYSRNSSLASTVHGARYLASGGGSAVDVQLPYYSRKLLIDFDVLVPCVFNLFRVSQFD